MNQSIEIASARGKAGEISLVALLSAVLLVAGSFKIPSPFFGGEFQLSAPLAVLMCAFFGFRRYLFAGIAASVVGMALGLATPFNVIVAMVFRLVAGGVVCLGRRHIAALVIAGPLGTAAARCVLAPVLGVDVMILLAAAVPGMIMTAAAVLFLIKPLRAAIKRI
ncbi:MAG: hypothetical protein IIV92_04080 [Schwartzia sp.]|nr:hypothetical protein [Schwartzia sp. (in: firmicutes)]